MRIAVPWEKNVVSAFCCGPHYLLFIGLMCIFAALGFLLAARDGWELFSLSIVTFWLSFVEWFWYLDFVWRLSISGGKNEAFFKDGTVIVRRKSYRDPRMSSLIPLVGLYASHLMLTIYIHVQRNNTSGELALYAHPLVNGVFLAFLMIVLVYALFIARRYLDVIVLSPVGISLQNRGETKSEVSWDDAKDVRLLESGGRTDAMKSHLHFELRPSNESTRDKWWVPLFPSVQTDTRGYDTEPNAILRASKECLEYPESRAVLGTLEGVDFVTYGPPWHEVYKMKNGTEWDG